MIQGSRAQPEIPGKRATRGAALRVILELRALQVIPESMGIKETRAQKVIRAPTVQSKEIPELLDLQEIPG